MCSKLLFLKDDFMGDAISIDDGAINKVTYPLTNDGGKSFCFDPLCELVNLYYRILLDLFPWILARSD